MDLIDFDNKILENGELHIFGDVHISESSQLTNHANITKETGGPTIQIGDFSMLERDHTWWNQYICKGVHAVLGGNHDHYPSIKSGDHSLGDFGMLEKSGIMFIRGAQTPDFHFSREPKKQGINWWAEEEITEEQMRRAIEMYVGKEPKIMITHDTVDRVRRKVHGINEPTRTSDLLQTLFEIHKPHTWIYGHHHVSSRNSLDGCDFICIGSGEKHLIKI